ncbi:MAG: hypothetical protein ABJE95_31005 [Byssovorax sp.]
MSGAALFVRRLVAGLAGVSAGIFFLVRMSDREARPGLIPLVGLLIAAVAIHAPRLGPQLLARAAWWSSFALGVMLCFLGGRQVRAAGVGLVLACGGALLLAGRKELGAAGEEGGYAPAAFRSTLLLLMVFALADTQTFLLLGALMLDGSGSRNTPAGVLMLAASVIYVVGFVGLYRLALWGALLNLAVSVGLLLCIAGGAVHSDSELCTIVAVISGVHILATTPMLAALVFNFEIPKPGPRLRAFGAAAVIVAVGLVSVARVMLP